ncbi:putative ribosomal protein L24 [Helianthus annuus]|nr:putative ribosomal protein L24 [Helianthus annuus]KAJ0608511.1 putative ribosomal protein L24 [Helianthus annuus]KAJ0768576.1 putative ribosomal protein L24 [Helianthus annuus]KAJ0774319.1 putative ribosomal protein L24 [Helianthus annuus]
MAAIATLQSSFTALSLSSKSFLGQRLSPCPSPPLVQQNKSTKTCPPLQAKLKRWERIKCKPNSLPIVHKMHVKLGDTVKVIAGRDKGKVGESGQIVKIEAPIHSSNVMLYSKEQNVASRVGHKTLDNGKRVRYLLKTGEIIDSVEIWKKAVKEREKKAEEITVAS